MTWYQLQVRPDDNGTWLVTSEDYPEITTFGEDMDEALHNGRRAIEEAIAARMKYQEDLPLPTIEERGNGYHVQLKPLIYTKATIYMVCREDEVSKAELARRMGAHPTQIDRIFDLNHNSKPDQIDAALEALGLITKIKIVRDPDNQAA